LGVAFISLRENLGLTTPVVRGMFQIIGAMAEFERSLMQEGVKAGLQNARAKGNARVVRASRYLWRRSSGYLAALRHYSPWGN
jgi:DNA invertase Pin-like site-specific DNA recombinase